MLKSAAEVEVSEAARLLMEWREALRARGDAGDCLERAQQEYDAAWARVESAKTAALAWVQR